MAESNIQWTHFTWNPARGCTKVSPGCDFCYMMRESMDGHRYDPETVTRTKTVFDAPLRLQKRRRYLAERISLGAATDKQREEYDRIKKIVLIFTSSLTDIFHPDIDPYRDEIWAIIRQCPEFIFQILTKRIERAKDCLPPDWGSGYSNVWLGCTVENQEYYNKRVPYLLSTPAIVHFVSYEPALGEIRFGHIDAELEGHPDYIQINPLTGKHSDMGRPWGTVPKLDWVIIGGESGNDKGKWRFRKARLQWYESAIEQCQEAGVAVFMKQMGTWLSKELKMSDRHGGDINEFPKHLKVREFPKAA